MQDNLLTVAVQLALWPSIGCGVFYDFTMTLR